MLTACDSTGDSWLVPHHYRWDPFLFLINMQKRGKLRAGDASELNVLELLFLDNLFSNRMTDTRLHMMEH